MQINYRLFYFLFIVSIMVSCDPEEMPSEAQTDQASLNHNLYADDTGEEDQYTDDKKN